MFLPHYDEHNSFIFFLSLCLSLYWPRSVYSITHFFSLSLLLLHKIYTPLYYLSYTYPTWWWWWSKILTAHFTQPQQTRFSPSQKSLPFQKMCVIFCSVWNGWEGGTKGKHLFTSSFCTYGPLYSSCCSAEWWLRINLIYSLPAVW